jgi:hypothetical protein
MKQPVRGKAGALAAAWVAATLGGLLLAVGLVAVLRTILALRYWESRNWDNILVVLIVSAGLACLPLGVFQNRVLGRAFAAYGWQPGHGWAWLVVTATGWGLFTLLNLLNWGAPLWLLAGSLALGTAQGLVLATLPAPTVRGRLSRAGIWAATGLIAGLCGELAGQGAGGTLLASLLVLMPVQAFVSALALVWLTRGAQARTTARV